MALGLWILSARAAGSGPGMVVPYVATPRSPPTHWRPRARRGPPWIRDREAAIAELRDVPLRQIELAEQVRVQRATVAARRHRRCERHRLRHDGVRVTQLDSAGRPLPTHRPAGPPAGDPDAHRPDPYRPGLSGTAGNAAPVGLRRIHNAGTCGHDHPPVARRLHRRGDGTGLIPGRDPARRRRDREARRPDAAARHARRGLPAHAGPHADELPREAAGRLFYKGDERVRDYRTVQKLRVGVVGLASPKRKSCA